MKINITALMNLIAEEEKNYSNLSYSIKNCVYNTTIQELDGRTNIIEDNKDEFKCELSELERLAKNIPKLKGILYNKNNSFKLSDGRTIQTAIIDNNNLRSLRSTYQNLLNYRSSKRRETEVNNSYFEIHEINYDQDSIKQKIKELDAAIQQTDFEISKLNSEEFIIEI